MAIEGLSEQVINYEFDEDAKAWVIGEADADTFLVTPDARYPVPAVQFFLKREDAEQYALEVMEVNEQLRDKNLQAKSVNVKEAIRRVNGAEPPCAAILHSPNAMYKYFRDKDEWQRLSEN